MLYFGVKRSQNDLKDRKLIFELFIRLCNKLDWWENQYLSVYIIWGWMLQSPLSLQSLLHYNKTKIKRPVP